MKTTTNLGLKKPEGTDIVNIDDINYNADIMDAEIGNIKKGVVKVGASGSSDTAAKLQTPRAISLNGDVIGNANFDGSANTCINARLQNSGVTAGSYTKVSVDEKGRVVAGSNPMTLAGYGITDALPASSYTAADVLNKLKTVHGEGSGLNADLLDGKDSTAFATAAQGAKADTALQTSQLNKSGGAVSYDVFKSYLDDNVKHITIAERTAWNNKVDSFSTSVSPQAGKIPILDSNGRLGMGAIQLGTNVTYYVNPSMGSDSNNGLTSGTPFKTIGNALSSLPRFILANITINLAPGTYNEDLWISSFFGEGQISIIGDTTVSSSYSVKSLVVKSCKCTVIIQGVNFTTTTANAITVVNSSYCYIDRCNIVGSASSYVGIYTSSSSSGTVIGTQISNRLITIFAERSTNLYCENNTGNGNITGYQSVTSSTLGYYGTIPTATISTSVYSGGVIRS